MNTLVLLLISVAVLFCGYVMYGGWLVKQWGVGEGDIPTPAHALEDGVDYVPAKAPVLMGLPAQVLLQVLSARLCSAGCL